MCNCIHELLNGFEDSAQRERTIATPCFILVGGPLEDGAGYFELSLQQCHHSNSPREICHQSTTCVNRACI